MVVWAVFVIRLDILRVLCHSNHAGALGMYRTVYGLSQRCSGHALTLFDLLTGGVKRISVVAEAMLAEAIHCYIHS